MAILLNEQELHLVRQGKMQQIILPLVPEPVKDVNNHWHWRDCEWLDNGIGFPASGVDDHAEFKVDETIDCGDFEIHILDISVLQIQDLDLCSQGKHMWNKKWSQSQLQYHSDPWVFVYNIGVTLK